MLNFEMELRIKFNREINKETDSALCPGGYTMTMNGRSISFDFVTSYGYIDEHHKECCEFCLEEPDNDSFSDLDDITIDDLRNITHIDECYVYTDEDSDLKEIEIERIVFYVHIDDEEEEILISPEVLQEYNRTICV